MWLERFIIVVVSLHRDFLTSSWGMYYPTRWDWMTYIGTIGMFLAAMFLFLRLLPAISIFEMRTLLPEAEVKSVNEARSHLRHHGGVRFGTRPWSMPRASTHQAGYKRSMPTARSRSKAWRKRSDSTATKFRWSC